MLQIGDWMKPFGLRWGKQFFQWQSKIPSGNSFGFIALSMAASAK
jgi:hypothetical protein